MTSPAPDRRAPLPEASVPEPHRRARILVVGNEKGGCGKSTIAMHLVVGFLRAGYSVASLDLDVRQGSLSRYLDNRANFMARRNVVLPISDHTRGGNPIHPGDVPGLVDRLTVGRDILIVDTPGRVDDVSMAAHALADTIVTPVGESPLDLDLIGNLDREAGRATKPGAYAEFVWTVRQRRAREGRPPVAWFVCHTRRRVPETRVGREVAGALVDLSKRFAFQLAPGFSERIIFQELFPEGLTLLDLRQAGIGLGLTMSHVAARTEIRNLLAALTPAVGNPSRFRRNAEPG